MEEGSGDFGGEVAVSGGGGQGLFVEEMVKSRRIFRKLEQKSRTNTSHVEK